MKLILLLMLALAGKATVGVSPNNKIPTASGSGSTTTLLKFDQVFKLDQKQICLPIGCTTFVALFPGKECARRTEFICNRSDNSKTVRFVGDMSAQRDTKPVISLLEENDPDRLQRLARSYQQISALPPKVVWHPQAFATHQNFLAVLADQSCNLDLVFSSTESRNDPNMQKSGPNIVKVVRWLTGLLREFHKLGLVAINFEIAYPYSFTDQTKPVLDQIGWMVKAGEPVGSGSFDPLLTDPVALKDPSFKADPALDYHVLGIHLQKLGSKRQLSILKIHEIDRKQASENGLYFFPSRSNMVLVLVACSFLQQDREARMSMEKFERLVNYLLGPDSLPLLEKDFNYDPKLDPWTLPEFELVTSKLDPLLAPKGTPLNGATQSNREGDEDDSLLEQLLDRWWLEILLGVLGCLVLFFVLYYCLRAKAPQEDAPVDASKELQTPDEPTIAL